jgi:hypothetical protein
MTKNLTQDLVDLSNWGFGTHGTAELHFNHREDCFGVRPLVVMLQENIPIENDCRNRLLEQLHDLWNRRHFWCKAPLTGEGRVRVILQPKLERRKLKGFDYTVPAAAR